MELVGKAVMVDFARVSTDAACLIRRTLLSGFPDLWSIVEIAPFAVDRSQVLLGESSGNSRLFRFGASDSHGRRGS